MATLHLMVGLPGSGKTTEAIRLEHELHALRLTPDEWHRHLFGNDFKNDSSDTVHDERHTKWERLEKRNRTVEENAVFFITKESLEKWSGFFEPPTPEELEVP